MIDWFLSLIRQFRIHRDKVLLILVPRKGGTGDAISCLAPAAKKTSSNGHCRFVVNELASHISEVTKAGENCESDSLFLVAHPSKNRVGFAAAVGLQPLTPAWFERASRWHILVAHVCEGARILRRPGWQAVFPQWVSYEESLYFFACFERGRILWRQAIDRMVDAAAASEGATDCREKISAVYDGLIEEIEDDMIAEEGDILHAMYFKRAKEALTMSDSAYD